MPTIDKSIVLCVGAYMFIIIMYSGLVFQMFRVRHFDILQSISKSVLCYNLEVQTCGAGCTACINTDTISNSFSSLLHFSKPKIKVSVQFFSRIE